MGVNFKYLRQLLAKRILPAVIVALGGIGAIFIWLEDRIVLTTGNILLSASALLLLGYLFGPPLSYQAAKVWRKLTPKWDEISDALSNGTRLYHQRVRNETEFKKWKNDWSVWTYGTAELIKHTCGKPVSKAFIARPQAIAADIIGSFNYSHNAMRLQLSKRLEMLNRLLEKVS